MKYICATLVALLLFNCKKENIKCVEPASDISLLNLPNDSGYINLEKGLLFLLANSLTSDTSRWFSMSKNDTIGKYFRKQSSNHFLLCLVDIGSNDFETHLIVEVNSCGEIIKHERYVHDNYGCCWNNYYDGFQKYGDFYGIKSCATGSGYCRTDLNLFKTMVSQSDVLDILYDCNFIYEEGFTSLTTTKIEAKPQELTFYYNLKQGILDNKESHIIESEENYTVRYLFLNGEWKILDKTVYDKLTLF